MQILIERLKFFTLIFFAISLVACGGGGVAGGGDDPEDDEVVDDGEVTGDGFSMSIGLYSGGTSTTSFDPGTLPLENAVSSVSSVESVVVAVAVVSSSGAELGNVRVTLAADVGTLGSPNNSVITGLNGIGSTSLSVAAADSGAVGTLTATLDGVSTSVDYSVGSVDLKLGRDSNGDDNPLMYSPADFVDGEIDLQLTDDEEILTLGAGSSTQLDVIVVDTNNQLFTSPVDIHFTSICAESGDAMIDTVVPSSGGEASSTYTATGCDGVDQINASIVQVPGVNATGSLIVETAEISGIEFVSTDPTLIALRGTGTGIVPERANVLFRVVDDTGEGVQGQTVSFALFSDIGGIEFTGSGGVEASGDTNSEGFVSIGVQSGSIPTSVSVIASLDHDSDPNTPDIKTSSNNLLISTGLPDQNSFSISASILNPGGHQVENIISEISINPADKFNNPVADNTAITLRTEYGRVVGTCTTIDGACTVDWNSQSPRFPDSPLTGNVLTIDDLACDTDNDGFIRNDGSDSTGYPCLDRLRDTSEGFPFDVSDVGLEGNINLGEIFGGRTTILAYAIGEESFTDDNANGRYDEGEPFDDLAEAFIDHNEDGVFGNPGTPGGCESRTDTDTAGINCSGWRVGGADEEHIDIINDGAFTPGNGIYNGSLCSDAAEAAGACVTDLVHVRNRIVLNAGGSSPRIGIYRTDDVLLSAGTSVTSRNVDLTVDDPNDPADNTRRIVVSDLFNGLLPAGTTIDVSAENCEVVGIESYEIANTDAKGNLVFDISLAADTNTTAEDAVIITVTPSASSLGAPVSASFSCKDI